jgi:hypothetical protein
MVGPFSVRTRTPRLRTLAVDPKGMAPVHTLSSGSEILVAFSSDPTGRGSGEIVTARCIVQVITEHLITLDLEPGVPSPFAGTLVDITIGHRRYRSTVQRGGSSTFVLLRPRELEDLQQRQRYFTPSIDGLALE